MPSPTLRRLRAITIALPFLATSTLVAQSAAAPKTGVTSASANGFTVVHAVRINAAPTRVYEALTTQVGKWWNPDHSYSKNADNLSMAPKAGGCFCEILPNGGSVEHMRVVMVMPNRLLRLEGGLGPLQSLGVGAHMTWEFAADGSATKLTMTYVVGGYMDGGLDKMSAPVSGMLQETIGRLQRFIETGAPAAK